MDFKEFFLSFKTHTAPVPTIVKIRSSLMAGIAVLILGLVLEYLPQSNYPLVMLSSVGASAVLLFVVPHSPMAQPWPLFGGHLVATLTGWLCSQHISDTLLAASCAVGLAVLLMHYLKCLHPPSAATALTIVLSSAQFHPMGWPWVTYIVLVNIGTFLVLALLIHNLIPGRYYPMQHISQPAPQKDTQPKHAQLEQANIEWALTQMDDVIDASEEDLIEIYKLAIQHAQNDDGKINA